MPATLKSRLPEVARSLQLRVGRDLKKGAYDILDVANALLDAKPTHGQSPATPELSSIGKVTGGAAEYKVEYDAFWAEWVELGRAHAAPSPFLIPAAEQEMPRIEAKVAATLKSL